LPRPKPARADLEALMLPRPRPKPSLEERMASIPRPRAKPELVTSISTPPPAPPPSIAENEMTPPPPAETIVSPQATALAELRGSAEPPAAPPAKVVNPAAGFSIVTRVRFRTGGAELGPEAKAALDSLARRLLANEERVRLAAFSGHPGDISSDARRLSLQRALAVRAYLAKKGIATERVDVLAFGGSTDGTSDRVDVLVRAI
jgi:outer membrane protein OmpA-like peptidoglycan-associated protein